MRKYVRAMIRNNADTQAKASKFVSYVWNKIATKRWNEDIRAHRCKLGSKGGKLGRYHKRAFA